MEVTPVATDALQFHNAFIAALTPSALFVLAISVCAERQQTMAFSATGSSMPLGTLHTG